MLKDITLGQYFPTNSIIHKLDPRIKIILIFVYVTILFLIKTYLSYALITVFTLTIIFLSKIPLKLILKGLRPLLYLIIFTALINIFMTEGDLIFAFFFLKATYQGLNQAILMILRLVLLIMGTSLLTYTTSPILLTDGLERLMLPFKKLGLPSHELAMMMTIALRFVPTLLEEADKIMKAQISRGADFEAKNLIKRAKGLVPLLIPLFVSAFRRADELAVAMECRCYRGGDNRTKMKQLRISKRDFIAVIIMSLITASVVMIDILGYY